MDTMPQDPIMLLSWVNMKLRDLYPSSAEADGLARLCDDLDVSRDELTAKLRQAGFEYIPSANQFR